MQHHRWRHSWKSLTRHDIRASILWKTGSRSKETCGCWELTLSWGLWAVEQEDKGKLIEGQEALTFWWESKHMEDNQHKTKNIPKGELKGRPIHLYRLSQDPGTLFSMPYTQKVTCIWLSQIIYLITYSFATLADNFGHFQHSNLLSCDTTDDKDVNLFFLTSVSAASRPAQVLSHCSDIK